MIDVTPSEAVTLATSETQGRARGSREEESTFERVKKIFANGVKSAVRWDSTISIPYKLPYFIIFVGLCESFLAVPLEFEQGHARTAAVYIGGGLAGSLGASAFDNDSKLVGASGGIYALLISQISHIILNCSILNYVLYRMLAVLLLALADVLYICYHVYVFNNESPRISLAAHFGGALSGLLLGVLFFNGTVQWRNSLRIITAIIVFLLIISWVSYNLLSGFKCVD